MQNRRLHTQQYCSAEHLAHPATDCFVQRSDQPPNSYQPHTEIRVNRFQRLNVEKQHTVRDEHIPKLLLLLRLQVRMKPPTGSTILRHLELFGSLKHQYGIAMQHFHEVGWK